MTFDDFLSRFDVIEDDRDGHVVHCPAHTDSHPSLRITVSDKGIVLLKCRAGCETKNVMAALGLSMRDLTTMEVDAVDFKPATSTDVPASGADIARLAADLDRWARLWEHYGDAREYAAARFGIDLDAGHRLGVGVTDELPGGLRLVVPFRDLDGVARGYQARALDPDEKIRWYGPPSPEGASWAKVGFFPGGSDWQEVLITEGPGDALTACAQGYDAIMVRGAGLASNASVVATIAEWVGDRVAVVCGDGDPSGRTFAATLVRGLLTSGCKAKNLPVPDDHDLTSWRERDGDRFGTTLVRAVLDTPEEVATDAIMRDRDRSRYPFTDLGNARFVRDFVTAQGAGVKYSPEAGFFLLRKGVWVPDKLNRTRAYVQEAADLVATIARRLADQTNPQDKAAMDAVKSWRSWANYSQSSRGIGAALVELQALPDVATDLEDFDKHSDLLAVENGVVDLRTGELGPHDPSLLMTRKVHVAYDPAATAPRWEAYLEQVFPSHPDLPGYMQRLVGYGITGRTDEQCFAVLWGTGANGKSVFTDTLTGLFDDVTVTTPFSTFEERQSGGIPNDIAALKGARLVMAAEGEQGKPMAEAVLKRVTGTDRITARFMRREFFEFHPTFLLMLATNFKPRFQGQDEGLWRRVKLIPWERFFKPHERDAGLGRALQAEYKGILTWAVRGAVEWFASGLRDPEVVRNATVEYRETSDALAGFLPGVFVRDPQAPRIDGGLLFREYLDWADAENLPPKERWTRQRFYSALEERGGVKRKTAKGVAFEGVRRTRQTDIGTDPETGESPAGPIAAPSRGASLSDVM